MTALKTPEKTSRRKELRQNKFVELYARALLFYEENRKLVYGLGIGILLLILATPGYLYYQQQQEEQANEMLGRILPVYEQGNYQQALEGSGDRPGLLTIADEYSSTSAGNLAAFYGANALYQLEEYDRALQYYQEFDKDDDFIGASAYAAEAAIYENRGELERAAELYEQAASQYPNRMTAPRYLLNAGRAYEELGQYDAAERVYEQIREEYPDAEQADEVKRYLSRVKARQADSAS